MRPRAAGRLVPVLDVVETPLDLGYRVRAPVLAELGHLAAGQRLGDAVRARARVGGPLVPAALPLEEPVQTGELVDGEALFQHQRTADPAVAAELLAGSRDRPVRLGRH